MLQLALKIFTFNRWDAESIFCKNPLSTLKLLLAIINHYSTSGQVFVDLPKSLVVTAIKKEKREGEIFTQKWTEKLIGFGHNVNIARDGFDTLIDHAPEKLQYVKQSLLQFSNVHLGKVLQKLRV